MAISSSTSNFHLLVWVLLTSTSTLFFGTSSQLDQPSNNHNNYYYNLMSWTRPTTATVTFPYALSRDRQPYTNYYESTKARSSNNNGYESTKARSSRNNGYDSTKARSSNNNYYDSTMTRARSSRPFRVVVVDQSGHGDFTRVQAAIDSVPQNNRHWVWIEIKAGIYKEKVAITGDKPYIILKGQGMGLTKIVWDDHFTTLQSPTFMSQAENIVVRNISFVNSYNYPDGGRNRILPAAAALVNGDKTSFYGCGFFSVQDTLWDNEGRHYFKDCIIEGAVDFIFGRGQSIYENCDIRAIGGGFITAHSREAPDDPSGYVFKGCTISGRGPSYLGRPWRQYARVLFYKCKLSDIVEPKGWNPWNGDMNKVTFSEYGNFGPGADTSKRVGFEKLNLPIQVWMEMTSISYINKDGWLERQPR